MRSIRSQIPTLMWVGAGALLLLLLLAGGLALVGRPVDGLKLALFVGLFPCLVLIVASLARFVRQPDWQGGRTVFGLLVVVGSILFLVPLFLWLPFSPATWRVQEMPLPLRMPFIAGLAIFSLTAVVAALRQLWEAWKGRDYLTFAADLLAIGLVGAIAAVAVIIRLT
jgi:hypothetical protein